MRKLLIADIVEYKQYDFFFLDWICFFQILILAIKSYLHEITTYTVRKYTFKVPVLKDLEREPLRYWKGNGKVTYTKPFLILGKVTFDKHVNVLERYCKDGISYTFIKPLWLSFQNQVSLKV